ncbi:MAG: hypothetical protein LC772_00010 [Chloroflexi bacterium]|nr:hypothetical protein [Chloroflexota bacterium]
MGFFGMGTFWMRMHGGSTHFPVALITASILFDLVALAIKREPHSRDLHVAAYYALLLAALASAAAVFSGLMVSGWDTVGTGMILKHHLYIWPGFGLLVAIAVWRLFVGYEPSVQGFAAYFSLAIVASILITAGAYWGGEMMMASMMQGMAAK